jgi:cytidylate kinase
MSSTTLNSNPPARQQPVIAIDGPAGAGKSTLAAHLARRFGFLNLETGAMYRALAYKAIENDLDLDDEAPLLELAEHTRITLEPTREGNRVLLDAMDVSRRIRDTDVTAAASRLSVHPRVREWMVAQQRALGASGGVVMEGRDIGTAVFPDAEVKIFLDADPEVRGVRRFRQVAPDQHEPVPITETVVLAEMRARDERDRSRAQSPLKPAADAVFLDSTAMSLDEVLARSEEIVRAHLSPQCDASAVQT